MHEYRNKIIQGHALAVLKEMPDNLVDCVITSPPYWSLRDYKTEPIVWPDGWKGQLGLEPTVELYLEHLLQIFDEIHRVLKKTGTLWVNLGDSYWNAKGSCFNPGGGVNSLEAKKKTLETYPLHRGNKSDNPGLPQKSLCLIPQRFVVAMVDHSGWIARNENIWHKPNPMPSSAKDRFTVDFEPVFFFTKQGGYWFDQQFEEVTGNTHPGRKDGQLSPYFQNDMGGFNRRVDSWNQNHIPAERNMRTVWSIPTAPFPEAHFATFPPKLAEIPIRAGCPEFVCPSCGHAREKIYEVEYEPLRNGRKRDQPKQRLKAESGLRAERPSGAQHAYANVIRTETGLTDCGCGAGWEPGVVLDPFAGSGTVAMVARQLRRDFVSIELSPEYIEIYERRLRDPKNAQVKLI